MKHNFYANPLNLLCGILLILQVQSATAQKSGPSENFNKTGNFTEVIDRKITPSDVHLLQKLIAGSEHAALLKNDASNKIYLLDNDGFKGEIAAFQALGKEVVIIDKNALSGINPTYLLTIDGFNKHDHSCEAIVNVHTTENGQRKLLPAKTQTITRSAANRASF